MAASGTVAVLLPGAFYSLRETRQPPVVALRAAGVPMAVSTDCNLGTSPLNRRHGDEYVSCTLSYRRRAEALGNDTLRRPRVIPGDSGTLEVGKRADLVLDVELPAELAT